MIGKCLQLLGGIASIVTDHAGREGVSDATFGTPVRWLRNALMAGLCGFAAHTLLMYFKSRAGLLPAFQPYEALQMTLGRLTGADVHPVVPWLLSWLNGSVVMGFAFGRCYRLIPGGNGAIKGLFFGLAGWMIRIDLLSTLSASLRRIRLSSRPRRCACTVFTRNAADLQHRHGRCLRGSQRDFYTTRSLKFRRSKYLGNVLRYGHHCRRNHCD